MKYIIGALVFVTTLVYFYIKPTSDYRVIDCGTFDQNIFVFVTKDTAMVREYSPNMDFSSRACTVNEDGIVIVWFPEDPDAGLLTHEMEHATMMVLSECGVPHTEETDEVFAYQLQYLINKFGNLK